MLGAPAAVGVAIGDRWSLVRHLGVQNDTGGKQQDSTDVSDASHTHRMNAFYAPFPLGSLSERLSRIARRQWIGNEQRTRCHESRTGNECRNCPAPMGSGRARLRRSRIRSQLSRNDLRLISKGGATMRMRSLGWFVGSLGLLLGAGSARAADQPMSGHDMAGQGAAREKASPNAATPESP